MCPRHLHRTLRHATSLTARRHNNLKSLVEMATSDLATTEQNYSVWEEVP
jgi:hypothetical protein